MPNRKAGKNTPDIVLGARVVEVRPETPRNAVDENESLLVGSSQFVSLVKELTVLEGAKEVGRALVLDSDEVAVRIVTDLDQAGIDVPGRVMNWNKLSELVDPAGLLA